MFKYWWQKITNTREIDPSVKVLIIEDNHVDARMFERAVDICGFTSLVAYDGRSGIEMAQNYAPRLIILDYQLPDMNGVQVLKGLRCKKETAKEPVMVLSVLDNSDVIINSFENGADQYFKKPIDLKTLVRQITLMIDKTH
jgi:DNA-binding response OmpR family regulator